MSLNPFFFFSGSVQILGRIFFTTLLGSVGWDGVTRGRGDGAGGPAYSAGPGHSGLAGGPGWAEVGRLGSRLQAPSLPSDRQTVQPGPQFCSHYK